SAASRKRKHLIEQIVENILAGSLVKQIGYRVMIGYGSDLAAAHLYGDIAANSSSVPTRKHTRTAKHAGNLEMTPLQEFSVSDGSDSEVILVVLPQSIELLPERMHRFYRHLGALELGELVSDEPGAQQTFHDDVQWEPMAVLGASLPAGSRDRRVQRDFRLEQPERLPCEIRHRNLVHSESLMNLAGEFP